MNTQSTIAQLRQITQLKLVSGAAEFGALFDSIQTAPAAFVIESVTEPGESLTCGPVLQEVNTTITVMIAVTTSRDSTGAASNQDLDTIRSLIRSKLLGWSPEAGALGYSLGVGRLMTYRPGLMWWSDTYHTTNTIKSV